MNDDDLDAPQIRTAPPQRKARPRDRYPSTSDPWELIRRAFFAPSRVLLHGKRRTVPKLLAYFRRLTELAARGQDWARREQLHFLNYMDKHAHLGLPAFRFDPEAAASNRKLARQRALMLKTRGMVFLQTRPEFKRRYTERHGVLRGFDDITLVDVDLDEARRELDRQARRRRIGRRGQPYDVGFGKPPLHTRWAKGVSGNPSGRPKAAGDVWDALQGFMMEPVAFTSDGVADKAPAFALTCDKLLTDGIRGERSACVPLRRLIDSLWKKGILHPPEPLPKQRKPSEGDQVTRMEDAYLFGTFAIRAFEELSRSYEQTYGPIEAFEPEIIREARAAVEKDRAFRALMREWLQEVQAEQNAGRSAQGTRSRGGRSRGKRSNSGDLARQIRSLLAGEPMRASPEEPSMPDRDAAELDRTSGEAAIKTQVRRIRITRKAPIQ